MHLLVFGAGRSSAALIHYLLENATAQNWTVTVADASLQAAQQKVNNHPKGTALGVDITDSHARRTLIERANIVASLMPPHLHQLIAGDCLLLRKHLVTASYLSKELRAMAQDVQNANILFMGEMGLDPGIDHLSAMQVIDTLRAKNAKILSFKSYTGGLVAPESDDNPWHYKFSWNPKNVVLAGQGVAQWIEGGNLKYLPYQRLYAQANTIKVLGMGNYDGYANRDSLSYRAVYGLETIPTLLRGTLRHAGYCRAWNIFVQLGMTDDSYSIDLSGKSYADFLEAFLPHDNSGRTLRRRFTDYFELSEYADETQKMDWLGFFDPNFSLLKDKGTPADILLELLLHKWVLRANDRDMIIMQHEFEYEIDEQLYRHTATLTYKGENAENTAMAQLVGLPMAILVKLLAQHKIQLRGLHIPVQAEIYTPVLAELATLGVHFEEQTEAL